MLVPSLTALAAGAAAGWVGYAWLPHLLSVGAVSRGPRSARRIALTFDDGPDARSTGRVLEALAARRVRGTFFLVGERAARAPETVRALAAAGHEIANHSWSHRSLWLCGPRRTDEEIGACQRLLADLTGQVPRHYRPPWGMVNAAMFGALRRHRARCVLWSIQPEGLAPRDPGRQAAHVLRRAHPGAIVDLHDAEGLPGAPSRLLEALPPMIDGLRAAGYELVTVEELLGEDPPERGVTSRRTAGGRGI